MLGVKWKRQLHRERGTSLIETTSHQIRSGEVFDYLTHEMTLRGIELNPNPDREIPEGGQKPMEPAHAYVANSGSNTVSVIDTATNAVATVTVGNGPIWVATVVSPTVNIPSCGASACAQGFIGDFPQQGAATGQMRQFLGIRYAAAPRGANRWNPPKPFFCWGLSLPG